MRAVAVGLERASSCRPPSRVLERLIADRRPEARGCRPRGVLARQRAAGDLPCASASPQCSTRRRRPARRVIGAAMSPAANTAGSELRIARPPRTARRRGRGRRRPPGRRAGRRRAEDHEVGGQHFAALQPHARPGSMRSTSAPSRTSTPASHSSVVMSSPARSPRRSRLRALLGATRTTVEAAARSDAAASQPMKPAPTTTARGRAPPRRAARSASSTVRIVCRPGSARRRWAGARARSPWPARRRRRPAPGRPRGARPRASRSSAAARAPRRSVTPVGGEPGLVLERQVPGLESRRAGILGQRRPLVGEVRLGADEHDGGLAAGLAIAARGGKGGRASPDDDDPLVGLMRRRRRCGTGR